MVKLFKKIIPVFILVLLFSTVSFTAAEEQAIQISSTDGESFHPQLAVLGTNVYVTWTDTSPGNKDTLFSKSSDGGLTFDEEKNLSSNNGTSAFPRMEIFDEKIFVTWYDYSLGKSEIFISQSNDGGNSFETKVISNNAGASYNPWVKTDGTNVFVVWNDETPHMANINVQGPENVDVVLGDLEILLAKSHDGGKIFEIINLSNSKDAVSYDPRIALSGQNVYVTWNETTQNGDEVFFSMSQDSGGTFSEPINISNTNNPSTGSGIQVSGDNIYIIWNEAGDIFFSASNDNGISFSNPIKLSIYGKGSSITRDTQMAAFGSEVFVVWYNNSVNNGVFLSKSMDNGRTFESPIKIADFGHFLDAQISSFEDNLNIVTNQVSDESHVFLRSSQDGGLSFGNLEKISQGYDKSNLSVLGPQIVATLDKTFIVFESEKNGISDLYLRIIDSKTPLKNEDIILSSTEETFEVAVDFGKELPNLENKTRFNLEFNDPETKTLIDNVHYTFEIIDSQGNQIFSRQNQVATDGKDVQTVQFPKSGSATIKINVLGTGLEHIDSARYSGETSAVITVVPEFPIGALFVLSLVSIGIIILGKFPRYQIKSK